MKETSGARSFVFGISFLASLVGSIAAVHYALQQYHY
jgi:hypothetical protein